MNWFSRFSRSAPVPEPVKTPSTRPEQAAAEHPANVLLVNFINRLHGVRAAQVLELGTKRSNPDRSTVHRVRNNTSGRDRYSVAFFFDIDYHAEVVALPGCHDAANPPRYPPITAGGHIVEMYQRTTGMTTT